MRDLLADIDRWREQSKPVALATVIETWGSAPRTVGANMALTADGEIAGSVSGGCVEGAVYETGREVLQSGSPQLLHFGVADETAWDVGLACGGTIDVFVERLEPEAYSLARAFLEADESFARATVIGGPTVLVGRSLIVQADSQVYGEIGQGLDDAIATAAKNDLGRGVSGRHALPALESTAESLEIFVEVSLPSPSLVMIGGVHIAIALTTIARTLGYRTIVIDPRRAFGSEERFSHVDRLIQAWPDKAFEQLRVTSSTAVASLTHDPKIDDPALKLALESPAFYVGALGSRKTHSRRRGRLIAAGVPEADVDRIRGPIGLDIGAQTPEEIGLAIMAEITSVSRAR
jgi:xanthine dehydrogenase accessory factor